MGKQLAWLCSNFEGINLEATSKLTKHLFKSIQQWNCKIVKLWFDLFRALLALLGLYISLANQILALALCLYRHESGIDLV